MKNKITNEDIVHILNKSSIETTKMGDKTTVVMCKLPNDFVIVESSSCVDPANYNESLGAKICMDRITNKIWELEGYKLQCELL